MYVYWWHVRGLHAVKVGHAEDPRQQVSDYRREYALGGKDVRGYRLGEGIDAGWVESQLCRQLEAMGLRRVVLESESSEDEFFALDARTFEDIQERLQSAARHIVFAEASNRLKQQRRREFEAAQDPQPARQPEPARREAEPRRQEPRPDQGEEGRAPRRRPPPLPVSMHVALFLVCAFAAWALVTGFGIDDMAVGLVSAEIPAQKASPVALLGRDSSPRAQQQKPCALVEISDTLVHVRCPGSWASMRWNGRWTVETGFEESDALAFFDASDLARRVAAPSPQKPQPPRPEPDRVTAEQPPPSADKATRPAPPTAPQTPSVVQPAVPRPATMTPPPPAPLPREAQFARQSCSVSRPQPGFQVYLVTCPDSRATIGRTRDSPDGWTVSESENGTAAIDFFMKSRYAR